MLKTIAIVLAVLWLLGMVGGIAEGIIHLLLVAALALLVYDLLLGRRRAHLH